MPRMVAAQDYVINVVSVDVSGDDVWDSAILGMMRGTLLGFLPNVRLCILPEGGQVTCSNVCQDSRQCGMRLQPPVRAGRNLQVAVDHITAGGAAQAMARFTVPDPARCMDAPCTFESDPSTVAIHFALTHIAPPTPPPAPARRPAPAAPAPAPTDWLTSYCEGTSGEGRSRVVSEVIDWGHSLRDFFGASFEGLFDPYRSYQCGTPPRVDRLLDLQAMRALLVSRAETRRLGGREVGGFILRETSGNRHALSVSPLAAGTTTSIDTANKICAFRGSPYTVTGNRASTCQLNISRQGTDTVSCAGSFHTHPEAWFDIGRHNFSAADLHAAQLARVPEYIITPACRVLRYWPSEGRPAVEPITISWTAAARASKRCYVQEVPYPEYGSAEYREQIAPLLEDAGCESVYAPLHAEAPGPTSIRLAKPAARK